MNLKMTNVSNKLEESTIKDIERTIGRPIPNSYRKFLNKYNGGRPEPSDFKMTSSNNLNHDTQIGTIKRFLGINLPEKTLNLDYVFKMFRDRIPENLFPIARDPGGNFICIVTENDDAGKVYFWDHEREADDGESPTDKNLYFIADSFDDFLDKLGDA